MIFFFFFGCSMILLKWQGSQQQEGALSSFLPGHPQQEGLIWDRRGQVPPPRSQPWSCVSIPSGVWQISAVTTSGHPRLPSGAALAWE